MSAALQAFRFELDDRVEIVGALAPKYPCANGIIRFIDQVGSLEIFRVELGNGETDEFIASELRLIRT